MPGGWNNKLWMFWGWIFALALLSTGCAQSARKGLEVRYYYAETADGKELVLRRYKPADLAADKSPVILCHGLSYNMLFWDLDPRVSLPLYLSDAGYDVWLLSLRGASPSTQPLNSALRKLGRFRFDEQALLARKNKLKTITMADWSVDEHIDLDVPAAIDRVIQETGHDKIHWIGHSMGGMILFGYLQVNPHAAAKVRSFVAVAAPMTVFHPVNDPFTLLIEAETALSVGSKIVGSSAPAALGTLFGDLDTPLDKLFYNGRNMDSEIIKRLSYLAEEEMSASQMKQLIGMVRTERFTSLDGKRDYTAMLNLVNTPTFFLAGTVDNMASPAAMQFAYRQIISDDKKFRLFGRVNAQKEDYGHDDLIIGRNAKQEVYPHILDWLRDHPCENRDPQLLLQPKPISGAN